MIDADCKMLWLMLIIDIMKVQAYRDFGAIGRENSMEKEQKVDGKDASIKQSKEASNASNQQTDGEPSAEQGYTASQQGRRLKEKMGIARYILKYIIQDDMSIFLDAGSTVEQVGHVLFNEQDKLNHYRQGLTILTNNMLVFEEFTKPELSFQMSDRGNVLALTGGAYNRNHKALFGPTVEEVLKAVCPVVVVIGTSGLIVEAEQKDTQPKTESQLLSGIFNHDLVSEGATKKAIAKKRTYHRVIVCDYSKIGIWDSSLFASITDLANHTEKCTIVTSVVPNPLYPYDMDQEYQNAGAGTAQISQYEKRYSAVKSALGLIGSSRIEIVQVDYEGNEYKAKKDENKTS